MVCVSCSTFLCCMDQHWLKSHPAIFCFKSMLTPRWLFLLLLTLFWVGCYGCYDLQQWMIYCGILQVLPKLSVYFVYINMLAAYDWLSSIIRFLLNVGGNACLHLCNVLFYFGLMIHSASVCLPTTFRISDQKHQEFIMEYHNTSLSYDLCTFIQLSLNEVFICIFLPI